MASFELIDTTEMYLKTIYEMEEDGVIPLRARIVERLGHSGPTVSQTIARMERDGLVVVREDRRLQLTDTGQEIALQVMRKHRLAERLLVDVIGLSWAQAHEEACRWEHVMSLAVEERLEDMLERPSHDPYGNPVPGMESTVPGEMSLDVAARKGEERSGTITRIGEPVQAEPWLLEELQQAGIVPGRPVIVSTDGTMVTARSGEENGPTVQIEGRFSPHLFLVKG